MVMVNSTEESSSGDCLICFSKFENYGLLPDEESQKIFDNCWSYLHEDIANRKLQIVKSKNKLRICKRCFDTASVLIELSEQATKFQKAISDLSFQFSLGVMYRRTQVESINNKSDDSQKELIILDVSRICPSLFTTYQPTPTSTPNIMEDLEHPCECSLKENDSVVNTFLQNPLKHVKHEESDGDISVYPKQNGESTKSKNPLVEENDTSIETRNYPSSTKMDIIVNDKCHSKLEIYDGADINITEELPACTQSMVVLTKVKESDVSGKFNSNVSPQQPDVSNLKQQLRNESSQKKIGQSTSSNITHRKTGTGNLKNVKTEHKCHECEKVFPSPSHLEKHIRAHTGDRPFACSICAKTFSVLSSVRTHEMTHTGEKPFKCPTCTKAFLLLSNLKIHQRIHTGEKPFKCSYCSKAFRQMVHIKRHERIHTEDQPFKCSLCEKTFVFESCVQRHEKIHRHTKVRPFKCSYCTKTFSTLDYARRHEKMHTRDGPFKIRLQIQNA